jgi:hypothetical protein
MVAGVAYTNLLNNCSTAFTAHNSVSGEYQLTAGHCIWNPNWPALGASTQTCYAGTTTCPWIGNDVGGYNYGVGAADAGVTGVWSWAWTNYPGWYVSAWGGAPYPIYGDQNAAPGMTLCKNGRTTGTTCGTFASFNANGLIEISGMCSIRGDSGAGVVNISNLFAIGIVSTSSNPDGPCTPYSVTSAEPVTRAVPTLGLTGITRVP